MYVIKDFSSGSGVSTSANVKHKNYYARISNESSKALSRSPLQKESLDYLIVQKENAEGGRERHGPRVATGNDGRLQVSSILECIEEAQDKRKIGGKKETQN